MTYVALLRGINVGGTNTVSMKELRDVFVEAGMTAAKTYINSGNVVFSTRRRARAQLVSVLERAIRNCNTTRKLLELMEKIAGDPA